VWAVAAGILAPAALAQQPSPGPPVVIDGPSAAIQTPSGLGMSVARDGTGGLVYLKQVGGVPHVFLSILAGGVFKAPTEIDSGLSGASSQPVIAAGNNGLLLVAFINGRVLYVAGRGSSATGLGSPAGLAGDAQNPAISMSNFGKAYLAFTVADGSGDDVRTAYYYGGTWSLESPPLNQTPADDAGTGAGRPEVATAGDGVAIVVWGESGRIFSRRVWGTSPSVVDEFADGPIPGCTEASADSPVVGAEGDSSYADVAFRETVTCNGEQQSRVLMNQLQGSVYDGITQPDGLSASSGGSALDPQITMGEYGAGWVTSEREVTNNVVARGLGGNGVPSGITEVNSLPDSIAPDPMPATAGLYSNLIAWQQAPGASGMPEIRARYAPQNGTLGPEMVLSTPSDGSTDAAAGIAAGGDVNGDGAVAWVQGEGSATEIVAAQLYQPPGSFPALKPLLYARNLQPRLAWSPATDAWGPLRYLVTLDGSQIGETEATALRVPAPLANGPHHWQVTAVNPAGRASVTRIATLFVDTISPLAAIRVKGRRVTGGRLQALVTYSDLPSPGEPRSDASGVASVVVGWGDGTVDRLKLGSHRLRHSYARAGRYTITVTAIDRAGNVTRVQLKLRIKAKPKAASVPKTSGKPGGASPGPTKTGKPGGAAPAPDRRIG
jgi:hypothetical protein